MHNYFKSICFLVIATLFVACDDDDSPTPDTTAPGEVSDFIAIPGDEEVTLSWSTPSDEDLAGFTVTYTPGNGEEAITNSTQTSITITGLTNDTEYTFTIQTVDETGNSSDGVSATGTPVSADLPPTNATNFEAVPADTEVVLTWTKPADPDLAGYELSYTPDGSTIDLGVNDETYTISELTNDTEYTFTLVSVDEADQKSEGISVTATPTTEKVPPGEVTDLSATIGDSEVVLTWTNPTDDDFVGLEIGYTPGDGAITIDEVVATYTVTGLTNDTEYTFTVQTRDAVGNISTGVTITATPADQPPLSPSDLNYTGDFDASTITVSWVKPSDDDLAGYELVYTDWSFTEGRLLPGLDEVDGSGTMSLDAAAESVSFPAIDDHIFVIELRAKDSGDNLSEVVGTTVYFGGVSLNHNLSTANGGTDFSLEERWNPDITHVVGGKLRLKDGVFDLTPLSNLEVVEGDIEIRNNNGTAGTVNTKLSSLAGLEKLRKINRMEVDGHDDLDDVSDYCALLTLVQTGPRDVGTDGDGYWWDGVDDNSNGWEPAGNTFNPTPQNILDSCQ